MTTNAELKKLVDNIIEKAKGVDYAFDGEDEIGYDVFYSDTCSDNLMTLISERQKEVAIAFAQWLVDDAYYAGQVNYETNQPKTTEELFNQFIKETITTA
jgi:hypothetical protein